MSCAFDKAHRFLACRTKLDGIPSTLTITLSNLQPRTSLRNNSLEQASENESRKRENVKTLLLVSLSRESAQNPPRRGKQFAQQIGNRHKFITLSCSFCFQSYLDFKLTSIIVQQMEIEICKWVFAHFPRFLYNHLDHPVSINYCAVMEIKICKQVFTHLSRIY